MEKITLREAAAPYDVLGAEGWGQFPEQLFVIHVGEGLYAANNATAPDGSYLMGLACFRTSEDGQTYMGTPEKGISGDLEAKTFEQCRQIAKSKEQLNCLLLFGKKNIIEFHFVR